MLPPVDTRLVSPVVDYVRETFLDLYPRVQTYLIDRLFADFEAMFDGRYLDYLPIDLGYHDREHTLQATVCLMEILRGRRDAGAAPGLSARHFEIVLAAVLLHDSGYLKLRSDRSGTGAKYTYVHVIRSCAIAASYLPAIGFSGSEIDAVVSIIRCTGPRSRIEEIYFADPIDRLLGCMLATADYLGQMAASDYVDELAILYAEFDESDDFLNTPLQERPFVSLRDLVEKTPAFWEKVVRPKLNHDYQAVYQFLARPYPDGINPYIEAVERNVLRARAIAQAPDISLDPFPQKPADSRTHPWSAPEIRAASVKQTGDK